MKKTFFFVTLLFMFFTACTTKTEGDSRVGFRSTDAIETSSFTESAVRPTDTAIPEPTQTSSWKLVWSNDFQNYGELLATKQGTENGIWLLYRKVLIWLPEQGQAKVFSFQEILGCEKCDVEINGTLAVTQDDEAWVGLTSGLLIVKKTDELFQLSSQDIVQEGSAEREIRALLVDQHGKIWINIENMLCKYSRNSWDCETFVELLDHNYVGGVDKVISATRGKDDQVWFGTRHGKLLFYGSGTFLIDDLSESHSVSNIGDMAFDQETGTIWAVSLSPPSCGEGVLSDRAGVLYKQGDNQWESFTLSLFADSYETRCYYPLTSIATTQEGVVWLGMIYKHGLVYFDGTEWKTLEGDTLPVFCDSCSNSDNTCGLPDCYTLDIFVSYNGRLLIANRIGVFEYVE